MDEKILRPALIGVVVVLLHAGVVPHAAARVHEFPEHEHGPGNGHEHEHGHGDGRIVDDADTRPRFITNRTGAPLDLPDEDEDAFMFAIFGDRTGGPPEGVKVLAEAVRDVNLIEPDLVMTVGDLIEGYNQRGAWLRQMREFKGIMSGLTMPWFPVAGNHDIYWRGPGRPAGEHEEGYERHFGPLWYAFGHKDCWFFVLYSDEGNPDTGVRSIDAPDAQRMSPEQLAWLEETLAKVADARHVFVFIHHPRWLGGQYGDDWNRVHPLLAAAGNVRAVFAGHIHRMRYDGVRDGIEYVTLATTGGAQGGHAPRAGYLHHYHLVTVRSDRIAIAGVPVGEVLDVRRITGVVSDETRRLAQLHPEVDGNVRMQSDGSTGDAFTVSVTNPVTRPIDLTLRLESRDSRWRLRPDHVHRVVAPGVTERFRFSVERAGASIDDSYRPIELVVSSEYLGDGLRVPVPERSLRVPVRPELTPPPRAPVETALALDGRHDYVEVGADLVPIPDGPLTLECWFNAREYGARTGLVTKTENSEYGIFVSNGQPDFSIFIGESYLAARAPGPILEVDRWHHIAGVYDGHEARLYVDGALVGSARRRGPRRTNGLPLLIGADVDGRGRAVSHFSGRIDGVRLSTRARYEGPRFTPARRVAPDAGTALLLNMDAVTPPWTYDESPARAHPVVVGAPRLSREP